jgi:hypothetical protein
VHVGDGLDGVVEAIAVLLAVAEALVVVHPADHVLHSGPHRAVAALSASSPGNCSPRGRLRCGVTLPQFR